MEARKLKHCVLMKFTETASEGTKSNIFRKLEALQFKDLGILELVHGPFKPSSAGSPSLNRDYTDGLVITFRCAEDRDNYNVDPDHERILQDDILPNLQGGREGLLRFDFEETVAGI
jgi:hypothetical protein